MESRREAQVLSQEAQKQKQGSLASKAPLGPQGQWDGEQSCRMVRQERAPASGFSGAKPDGTTQPLPSPSEPSPCAQGSTLGGKPWTLSAGPHSFLAKDRNGVERPGLGCPVLVVLASVIVSSFSTRVYRALELGLAVVLQSSSSAPACPWGPPRQCSIHSSVLPVELWLSKVGATGPPHQSVMMGHALGDQWVPQARCLLSQLESLQVLQGHVIAEVVLILGKEGTLSSDHPPAKEKGGR